MTEPIWNPPLTLCWAAIFGPEHRDLVRSLRRAGVLVIHGPKRDEQPGERRKDANNDPSR